ncbi:CID domain-containing protein [Salix suchowensis]|nr:CID domain-containing protein [Salix suchowensis]
MADVLRQGSRGPVTVMRRDLIVTVTSEGITSSSVWRTSRICAQSKPSVPYIRKPVIQSIMKCVGIQQICHTRNCNPSGPVLHLGKTIVSNRFRYKSGTMSIYSKATTLNLPTHTITPTPAHGYHYPYPPQRRRLQSTKADSKFEADHSELINASSRILTIRRNCNAVVGGSYSQGRRRNSKQDGRDAAYLAKWIPTGKELFGVAPQIGIERGVWGDGSSSSSVRSSSSQLSWILTLVQSGFYSGSGQITKAQVLSELEFTLGQKERNLQSNPYDSASRNHINVLHQEELHQILAQLRSLMKNAAPALIPSTSARSSASTSMAAQHHYPGSNQVQVPTPATSYGSPAPTYPPQSGPVKVEPTMARLPMPSAPEAASSVPNVGSIQNLLSTLVKAGVVRNGTPVTSGSDQSEAPSSNIEPIDLEKESMRSYRKKILAQNVQLTNTDLTRKRLDIVSLLYNRLPSQCKQCGIRFADSALGKKAMEEHLDMHFRQNRKASQGVGRGHSRSWFIGIEDWVNDFSRDAKGKGRADDGSRSSHHRAAAAADLAKRDAELRAQFVVVPQVMRQNRYLVLSVRKLLSLNFWRTTKIGCGKTL